MILSNRIALDTQIKQSIFELLSKKYPFLLFRKIYTKHLFLSDLPPEEQFEPAIREDEEPISYVGEHIRITILRYQSAGYLKYFKPLSRCLLIMDEVHYFLSDSLFNSNTRFLKDLIDKYQNAIRVYMTATPDGIRNVLMDYEFRHADRHNFGYQGGSGKKKKERYDNYGITLFPMSYDRLPRHPLTHLPIIPGMRNFTELHIPANYDAYSCYYFHNYEEIIQQIVNHSPAEKWLLFVNRISEGNSIREKLKAHHIICDFLHAKNKTTKIWKELLHNHKFPQQVLIVTKVLDNGFSLTGDPNLKHVVLPFADQTTIQQMIGRRRLDPDKNETVNLYFEIPSRLEVHSQFLHYGKMLQAIHAYHKNGSSILPVLWTKQDKAINNLFYISNSVSSQEQQSTGTSQSKTKKTASLKHQYLYLNPLAERMVRDLYQYHQYLLQPGSSLKLSIEIMYLLKVSRWLNKPFEAFLPVNRLIDSLSKKYIPIVDTYRSKEGFDEEALSKLHTDLLPAFDLLEGCRPRNDPKRKKMNVNVILRNLNPPLQIVKRQKRYYIEPYVPVPKELVFNV